MDYFNHFNTMHGRVITHQHLLKALHTLKPKYQKLILKACDEEEVNVICECIYNVLKGKIPLPEKEKKRLGKHKHILRKLISKGKNITRKNIIVQKGGAFLPIILGAVINGLLSTLLK